MKSKKQRKINRKLKVERYVEIEPPFTYINIPNPTKQTPIKRVEIFFDEKLAKFGPFIKKMAWLNKHGFEVWFKRYPGLYTKLIFEKKC